MCIHTVMSLMKDIFHNLRQSAVVKQTSVEKERHYFMKLIGYCTVINYGPIDLESLDC